MQILALWWTDPASFGRSQITIKKQQNTTSGFEDLISVYFGIGLVSSNDMKINESWACCVLVNVSFAASSL